MNKEAHVLEKNLLIIGSEIYMVRLIFPEHCCNHRSKRIEAVQFHHIAAGVETEQVCNLFAQRSHHVRV